MTKKITAEEFVKIIYANSFDNSNVWRITPDAWSRRLQLRVRLGIADETAYEVEVYPDKYPYSPGLVESTDVNSAQIDSSKPITKSASTINAVTFAKQVLLSSDAFSVAQVNAMLIEFIENGIIDPTKKVIDG